MKMGKFLEIAAIFLMLAGATYIVLDFSQEIGKKPTTFDEQLQGTVSADLNQLRISGEFPPEVDNVGFIRYQFRKNTPWDASIKKGIQSFLGKNQKATHVLEVEVFSSEDGSDNNLILQYSLFELASQNKIWEVARSYPIPQAL